MEETKNVSRTEGSELLRTATNAAPAQTKTQTHTEGWQLPAPGFEGPADGDPAQIGRYRIIRRLGQGGFGRVYLAHDDALDRPVAIKVPNPDRIARPEHVDAFFTEARILARLDHPNIVPVFDVGRTEDGLCFVVSKLFEGSDLATRIRQARPSIRESAEIVTTVADALHYAHNQGLVHRDIKPGNILIDAAGKPCVADFGIALRDEDFGKARGSGAGTPAYMSPEQARGEGHRVDRRSDIFSLGVVLYELITGQKPFFADSVSEVVDLITTTDPRPPRQTDHTIPLELERICQKSLSKRASERYSTAEEMAEELRLFLQAPVTAAPVAAPGAEGTTSASCLRNAFALPTTSKSGSPPSPIKIVPKGLRSFDAQDANFFLELLPGPRDRDGLPEVIRFWKGKIEQTDPNLTFKVGVIYGPSGCGKSSLVKAGLLPRLSRRVLVAYVEATPDETEARLLGGLRKACPELSRDLGLIDSLATVRRGRILPPEHKVLLVLDQFEQWLFARRGDENTDLVAALRHCDGQRVQAIALVRDDFWLAASRFMRDLEIRLVEGENSSLLDLFSPRHAKKVLTAFGRAHGALAEDTCDLSTDQESFLDRSIAGLTQDGKIISIRLALYAEMVKNKPWTPATLKEVGGTEGIGLAFLEETFSASTAPREHQLHQKAAQAVLKALLPETGTDIKGQMRSREELLEASGYSNRPEEFDDLIHILDPELRLITPTDKDQDGGRRDQDGGQRSALREPQDEVDGGRKHEDQLPQANALPTSSDLRPSSSVLHYYQLTHDYLVHSLRDWLTQKQKESWRGRAELILADRAGVWNARTENRQLPSLVQWVQIRCATRKKNWTAPQRRMMQTASWYHFGRATALGLVLAVVVITGLAVSNQADEQRNEAHAAELVERVLLAGTAQVPSIVTEMSTYRKWTDPLLRKRLTSTGMTPSQRLHAHLALLPRDSSLVDHVYDRLLDAGPHDVPVIRDALSRYKNTLLDRLWSVVEKPNRGRESERLRAAAALAKYDRDNPRWANCGAFVVNDLVLENPVFLGEWTEVFRPVSHHLVSQLSQIYLDHAPERTAERSLATNLLADYVSDQSELLANLLMDADEKQFPVIYPKFAEQGQFGLSFLESELEKQLPDVKTDWTVRFHKWQSDKQNNLPADWDAVLDSPVLSELRTPRLNLYGALEPPPAPAPKVPSEFFAVVATTNVTLANVDYVLATTFDDGIRVWLDNEIVIDYWGPNSPTTKSVTLSGKAGSHTIKVEFIQIEGRYALDVGLCIRDEVTDELAKRKANAAVAFYRMRYTEMLWPFLKHSPDPRLRSYLIHRLGPFGAEPGAILAQLKIEPDITIQTALILSLGEFREKDLPRETRAELLPMLEAVYVKATDPGLHAACEWLLRTWKQHARLCQLSDEWAKGLNASGACRVPEKFGRNAPGAEKQRAPGWYTTSQGQTMVVIPGPTDVVMGSPSTEAGRLDQEVQHKRRIDRTFALASRPVTVGQFRRFEKGYVPGPVSGGGMEFPVVGISWYMAAKYCNWLSKEDGIPEAQWCYTISGDKVEPRPRYLSLLGYRLPTEAEVEYATRANSVTSGYYGETEELLPKYAWYNKSSKGKLQPTGVLKPNDLGFFDVQGSVFIWCHEISKPYPSGNGQEVTLDKEDESPVNSTVARVLRGGSFDAQASYVRSACRIMNVPTFSAFDFGFRPARTIAP